MQKLNFQGIGALILSPLMFVLSFLVQNIYFKFGLNILIFYFFFGKIVLDSILNKFGDNSSSFKGFFSLIEYFSLILFMGFIINFIYGFISIPLHLYHLDFVYFLFFEFVGIFFSIVSRKQKKVLFSYSAQKSEIFIIFLLFLPSIFQIITNYQFSPSPFYIGWDIYQYSGITYEFLGNIRHYIVDWQYKKTVFFHIFQGNFILGSNVLFINHVEFDKLSILFTNGLSSLIVFNICKLFTKSNIIALLPSYFLASFRGGVALGPYYFLPSSLAWVFGLFALWFFEKANFLIRSVKDSPEASLKKKYGNFFLVFFIFSWIFLLLIHIYTGIIFSFALIMVVILRINTSRKLKMFILVGIILELLLLGISFLLNENTKNLISNYLIDSFFKDANLTIWSIEYTVNYFFIGRNRVLNPILGCIAIIIIVIKKRMILLPYIFNFLIFLLFIFYPLPALYRIAYLVVFFNVFLLSSMLEELNQSFFTFANKSDIFQNYYLQIKIYLHRMEKKGLKFSKNALKKGTEVAIILWIIFFCSIPTMFQHYQNLYPQSSVYTLNIKENNSVVYSSYNQYEFYGGEWLCSQKFDLNTTNLYSDPGLQRILFGLSGIHNVDFNSNSLTEFRNFIMNINETNLNLTQFESFIEEKKKDVLIAFSSRTFKWAETNSTIERFHAEAEWYDYLKVITLLENSKFELLYFNPQFVVFKVLA